MLYSAPTANGLNFLAFSDNMLKGEFRLVIISGNAGDGKTAFIQQFESFAENKGVAELLPDVARVETSLSRVTERAQLLPFLATFARRQGVSC